MNRYFFDVHDGLSCHDHEGTELGSVEAARAHAVFVATTYVNEPKMLHSAGGAIIVKVRDKEASVLSVYLAYNIEEH